MLYVKSLDKSLTNPIMLLSSYKYLGSLFPPYPFGRYKYLPSFC